MHENNKKYYLIGHQNREEFKYWKKSERNSEFVKRKYNIFIELNYARGQNRIYTDACKNKTGTETGTLLK